MNLKLTIIFGGLLVFSACSTSNQNENTNNSNSKNTQSVNSSFNPPVNLNNTKERKYADKLLNELNKNRELWKSQNISDYDYFCEVWGGGMTVFNPASIKVRDGKTSSSEEIVLSEYHFHYNFERIDSFEKMFDFIKEQVERGSSVNIDYNKKFGFPERFGINYSLIQHDFNSIKISKFRIIK